MGNTHWLTRSLFLICPADSPSLSHWLSNSEIHSLLFLQQLLLCGAVHRTSKTSETSKMPNFKISLINLKRGPTCLCLSPSSFPEARKSLFQLRWTKPARSWGVTSKYFVILCFSVVVLSPYAHFVGLHGCLEYLCGQFMSVSECFVICCVFVVDISISVVLSGLSAVVLRFFVVWSVLLQTEGLAQVPLTCTCVQKTPCSNPCMHIHILQSCV